MKPTQMKSEPSVNRNNPNHTVENTLQAIPEDWWLQAFQHYETIQYLSEIKLFWLKFLPLVTKDRPKDDGKALREILKYYTNVRNFYCCQINVKYFPKNILFGLIQVQGLYHSLLQLSTQFLLPLCCIS